MKTTRLLMKRHEEMLKFQEKISPFVPTIRELMDIWGLKTTSAVAFMLRRLVDRGMVITRETKERTKTSYYAVSDE